MAGAQSALGETPKTLNRLTLALFALFAAAYGMFTQDVRSFNTLCRAAMTANLVQYGRVEIDGYEGFTRDIAYREGHYYCDKAPGMSFLATPAAFVFTKIFPVTPERPYDRIWVAFLLLCAFTTAGLLCAGAGVLLFRWLLARTQNMAAALIGALAFALGGPVWGWATSFFSHAATAAFLVMGFIALDEARRRLAAGERSAAFALLAGLALGGATATEYTAVFAAAIIGAGAAATSPWVRPLETARLFAFAALGGLIALLPVLWFHAVAFGSPFTAGYAYTIEFDAHRTGLFGLNAPDPAVLLKLLVSAERGVIWYAPIVLAMGWATAKLIGSAQWRAAGVVVLAIAAWYLIMNAGFAYWHGGASTGPRYLTPAVGFAALALGLAWPLFNVWERRGALALLGLSIVINFAATAVDMTAGGAAIAPAFFAGDLRHTLTYRLLDEPSIAHFLPPLIIFAAFGWLIWRLVKQARGNIAPRAS